MQNFRFHSTSFVDPQKLMFGPQLKNVCLELKGRSLPDTFQRAARTLTRVGESLLQNRL